MDLADLAVRAASPGTIGATPAAHLWDLDRDDLPRYGSRRYQTRREDFSWSPPGCEPIFCVEPFPDANSRWPANSTLEEAPVARLVDISSGDLRFVARREVEAIATMVDVGPVENWMEE